MRALRCYGLGLASSRLETVESTKVQKKDTQAMKGMRHCAGTTLKVRHCTGPQISQYLGSATAAR